MEVYLSVNKYKLLDVFQELLKNNLPIDSTAILKKSSNRQNQGLHSENESCMM